MQSAFSEMIKKYICSTRCECPLPTGQFQLVLSCDCFMQVSISSKTFLPGQTPGTRLEVSKNPPPRDNHCVQKPSPRDKTGSQKPHPRDIKLEISQMVMDEIDTCISNKRSCRPYTSHSINKCTEVESM